MAQDTSPKATDYPDTPEGKHAWAQAVSRWNYQHNIKSEDLIAQWNKERNTRG